MYQTYSRRAGYVFGFIYMFYKYNKHRKKEVQEKRQLSYLQQSTTLKEILNSENKQLLVQFFEFMKRIGTSEKYQNNNLKSINSI
jgi:hypothetical protein